MGTGSDKRSLLISFWPVYISGFIILWLIGMETIEPDQNVNIRATFFTITFVSMLILMTSLEYRFYTMMDRLHGWRFLIIFGYSSIAVLLLYFLPVPSIMGNAIMGVVAALPFFLGICLGSLVVTFIDTVVGVVLSRLHHRIISTLILMIMIALIGGSFAGANLKDSDYLLGEDIPIDFKDDSVLQKSEYFFNEMSRRLYLRSKEIKTAQFLFLIFSVFTLLSIVSACSKMSHDILRNIYPLSEGLVRIGHGELDVRLQVRGSKEIKQLFSDFNQMVSDLSMAKNMHSAFGKYVNKDLLAIIEEQRGNPNVQAVSKEATVFFADVRGFTSMSENRSPADIVDFLNRFYSCIIPVIDHHEGYLNKFIGDEVMVVFNGPKDQEAHAELAAKCAVEIQKLIKYYNDEDTFKDVGGLNIGIGLATGTVVAGNVGSKDQMEYTVIGDAVNLAARLTGLAGKGEIIVNADNDEKNGLRSTPMDKVSIKGFSEPIVPSRLKFTV